MSITLDETRQVAALARLELSDADLVRMASHLSIILEYVAHLRLVPTEGIEPMVHPLAIYNVFRDDEPLPSLSVNEALSNAPARRDNPASGGAFFAVPAVLD